MLNDPAPSDPIPSDIAVWVIAPGNDEHARELLGDARDVADRLGSRVGVATVSDDDEAAACLIAHGADHVVVTATAAAGLPLAEAALRAARPRLVFTGAAGDDRELAARLAVRCDTLLLSPALAVRATSSHLEVTALHADGRRARQVSVEPGRTAIVGMRPGVGQPKPSDPHRRGTVCRIEVEPTREAVRLERTIPADPAAADIRHLPRLVAGGRGLGGREGFDLLRRIAGLLDAGVAASRVAVDLGWIERDRQVGQTGKTVQPELYLAVGISGASHHLEGMSSSRHVVALNADPQAPIFRTAHLGLAADWRPTLEALERLLRGRNNAAPSWHPRSPERG